MSDAKEHNEKIFRDWEKAMNASGEKVFCALVKNEKGEVKFYAHQSQTPAMVGKYLEAIGKKLQTITVQKDKSKPN